MKKLLSITMLLLTCTTLDAANTQKNQLREPPTNPPTLFPDFGKLLAEIKTLNDNVVNLTHALNDNGKSLEQEWSKTNTQISSALEVARSVDSQWQASNQHFANAIDLVETRYTVGTLVGVSIAVGLAPAIVNLICLPVVYYVAKRGYFAGSSQTARN